MGAIARGPSRVFVLAGIAVLVLGLGLLGIRALRTRSATTAEPASTPSRGRPGSTNPLYVALGHFDEKRYAELDALFDELFASQRVDPNGNWVVTQCAVAIENPPGGRLVDDDLWRAHLAQFAEWEARQPTSSTALTLHGRAWIAYAWVARGSDVASAVGPAQWQQFEERLAEARLLLDRALAQPQPSPLAYAGMLTVGMGESWSRERMNEMFERAVTQAPQYPALYTHMAIALLPRWGGAPGDWQRLAEASVTRTRAALGMGMYARIVHAIINYAGVPEVLHPNYISWSLLRQGWQDLGSRYENQTWFLEQRGYAACLFGDRSEALDVFGLMQGTMCMEVWKSHEHLDELADWARRPPADEETVQRMADARVTIDLERGHLLNLVQQIRERLVLGFAIDDRLDGLPAPIDVQQADLSLHLPEIALDQLLRQVLEPKGLGFAVVRGTVLISTPERLAHAAQTIDAVDAKLASAAPGPLLAKLNQGKYFLNWTQNSMEAVCRSLTKFAGVPVRLRDPALCVRRIWLQAEGLTLRSILALVAFQLDADLNFDGTELVIEPRGAAPPTDRR